MKNSMFFILNILLILCMSIFFPPIDNYKLINLISTFIFSFTQGKIFYENKIRIKKYVPFIVCGVSIGLCINNIQSNDFSFIDSIIGFFILTLFNYIGYLYSYKKS